MKIKISRREAKETLHWLDLTLTYESQILEDEKVKLLDEGEQIRKILSAIIKKLGVKKRTFGNLLPCALFLVPFSLISPFNEPFF